VDSASRSRAEAARIPGRKQKPVEAQGKMSASFCAALFAP
jgi:hypothetical protein